jgi:DedD protein
MALFKFRKAGDGSPPSPAQPETIEALRRRARHRLIGAAVLVLLGIIGFPLLFDTQPRPVAVDIPIEIPDRNKAKPLPPPATAAAQVAQAKTPEPAPVPVPVPPKAASPQPDAAKPEPPKVEAAKPKAEPPLQAKAEPATKPAAPDGARAQALLEGKPVQAGGSDAADGRFVVQVGAFADVAKARETRQKVERAGLKTYTHVAETREGKRIRVRVGPFATRAEADKAAGRIKELELPAAVLTL